MALILTNLKALVVVLGIAIAVFIVAKPICLRFMQEDAFTRRRNVWLALTLTAFISPSFWLFVVIAIPLLAWSVRKDPNPIALYLLVMQVIPQSIALEIPVIGIHHLFDIHIYRILSFALLLPVTWRLIQSRDNTRSVRPTSMDILLIAYGVLTLVLLMPYESITHTLRRGFLFTIDALLLYFVVSRTCTSRNAIVEAMASFCLACAIFAPLALFESLRHWLLYTGIGEQWGHALEFAYLLREDTLRAQVSAGHSIPLGYMMAIGFGFWLYLSSRVESRSLGFAVAMWMWMGLIAAYSRAPWIIALVVFLAYPAFSPGGSARFFKALLVTAVIGSLVAVSPIGERILDNIPFVGTVDAGSVTYRQRLAEMSWELIKQNPFFGSPFVLLYLEDLRQGQGIIDLMNTYATVAMYYGLVGLALFVGFFVTGMWNAYRVAKSSARSDPQLSLLGVNVIACMVGSLFMMATGGFGAALEKTSYVLIGLLAGYAQLSQLRRTTDDRHFQAKWDHSPVRR
jgi:O-antigen ligase/polysaccharide polymerase Wzy-like membrane protein